MPASYDEAGGYIGPEGFDPESGEWKDGFDEQRALWERQYDEARERCEEAVNRCPKQAIKLADG